MAELTAVFVIGLVFGGLIVAAWMSDHGPVGEILNEPPHRAWREGGFIVTDRPLNYEESLGLREGFDGLPRRFI